MFSFLSRLVVPRPPTVRTPACHKCKRPINAHATSCWSPAEGAYMAYRCKCGNLSTLAKPLYEAWRAGYRSPAEHEAAIQNTTNDLVP